MWKNYQGKYQSKILKKEMNFFYWEKKSTNKNCMSGANQKTRSSKKVEAVFFFFYCEEIKLSFGQFNELTI